MTAAKPPLLLLTAFAALACAGEVRAQVPAFPGAEGFGRFASGGRGGRVLAVTTLADGGPGSLRAAVGETGPRTVVFRVSGTIALDSELVVREGNLTIAGQTAPGDGVCLRDAVVRLDADNVIVRHLRFRLGDRRHSAEDAFSGNGSRRRMPRTIIVDHCSMSWAVDECASFYDVRDFTMQWCFITESLNRSAHPKGEHGFGGIWGGWRASFHHNLLAHNSSRNPRFHGSRYLGIPDSELVDFRNNVIYNWVSTSAYGGERGNQNIVANYYKSGPATRDSARSMIVEPYDSLGNWYVAGNHVEGFPAVSADNWNGGVHGRFAEAQRARRRSGPFPSAGIATGTPAEAFTAVLDRGGATRPKRDAVDARIAGEVRAGTARGPGRGIINSQADAGGWPVLASIPAPPDTDGDGMPDAWERGQGLDPENPADGTRAGNDGYTNLERYLNSLTGP
jgi:hypothetical protein